MKRLDQVIDVIIERFDAENNLMVKEHTITDMIAQNGVSILTRNQIPVGDFLLFKTADGYFQSSAVVKSARFAEDFIQRLTLEFVGEGWEKKWIYAHSETVSPLLEEFYDIAEEMSLLLQILMQDREQNQAPDEVFLLQLQENVDRLRSITFRIRKA